MKKGDKKTKKEKLNDLYDNEKGQKKRKKKEKHDNLWDDKKEQVRKNDKKERWIKFYGR